LNDGLTALPTCESTAVLVVKKTKVFMLFTKNQVVSIVNNFNGEKRSIKFKNAEPLLKTGDWKLEETPAVEAPKAEEPAAEAINAAETPTAETPAEETPAVEAPKAEEPADKPAAMATTSVTNVILEGPEDTSTEKKRSQKKVNYKFNENAKKFFKPGHVESVTEENAAIFNKKHFGQIVP